MARRRSKRATPLMLFWSRTEQRRFIDAVERLVSTVNDLETLLVRTKRGRRSGTAKDTTEGTARHVS